MQFLCENSFGPNIDYTTPSFKLKMFLFKTNRWC